MFDYDTHSPQLSSTRNRPARGQGAFSFRRQLDQLEMNVTDLDLDRFVHRVNRLLETYVPEAYAVSREEAFEFDRETILYYQGEGIIDSPSQLAHWQASQEYGFRQILQALLLKKMLVRGLPLRRIAFLMTGMDNEVYKRLLERGFDDEMAIRPQQPLAHSSQQPISFNQRPREIDLQSSQYWSEPFQEEIRYEEPSLADHLTMNPVPHQNEAYWRRVTVHPGLEIHISDDFRSPMSAMETKSILRQIQRAIESRDI